MQSLLARGQRPSQLMLGRKLKSRVDVSKLIEGFSKNVKPETPEGVPVWFCTFSGPRNWLRGTMYRHIEQVMVDVRDLQKNTHRRYLSQIRKAQPGYSSEEIYPVVSESNSISAPDPTHYDEEIAENGAVPLIVEDVGFCEMIRTLQQVIHPQGIRNALASHWSVIPHRGEELL